jgi:hypothetical protein
MMAVARIQNAASMPSICGGLRISRVLGKGARELVVEVAVVKVMVTVAVSDLVTLVIIVSVVVVVTCSVPNVLVHVIVVLAHVIVVYETPRPTGLDVHTTPLDEIRQRDRMDRTDNTRPYIVNLLPELSNAARVDLHLRGFTTQNPLFRFIRVNGMTTHMVPLEHLRH